MKILERLVTALMKFLATVPLPARLNGHAVVAGLPVPTGDLAPAAGGPS